MGSGKQQSAKGYKENAATGVQRHSVACAKAMNSYRDKLAARGGAVARRDLGLCEAFTQNH